MYNSRFMFIIWWFLFVCLYSGALEAYEQCRIPRAQIVSARTEAKGAAHPQSFYDWLYNEIPSKKNSTS